MEFLRGFLVLLALLAAAAGGMSEVSAVGEEQKQQAQPVAVRDDEGQWVKLSRPAERIVSLAPSLTELLFAIAAGERVVGTMEYSDYPPAAAAITVVGRHNMLDVERILSLSPDLVVAWQSGNPQAALAQLRQLGLTVYVAEPKDLASVASHLQRLGVLTGLDASADAAADDFLARLDALTRQYRSKMPLRVFYQVWDAPLITAGGDELINDIISLCGGRNVFAHLRLAGPKVSIEGVLLADPQVIIASGADSTRPPWLDEWQRWPQLAAVQSKQLYAIAPDLLQRHTPRALDGATLMCQFIDAARDSLQESQQESQQEPLQESL